MVPSLPLKVGRLDEVHGLHALDAAVPKGQVRGRDLAQDTAYLGVADVPFDDWTDVVRLVDAEDAFQHRLIARGGVNRLDVVALVAATRHSEEIAFELGELGLVHQTRHDEVAVVNKGLHLGGGERLGDLNGRTGFHFDCFHSATGSV